MNKDYLERAAAFCLGAIAALAFCWALMLGQPHEGSSASDGGDERSASPAMEVSDHIMPLGRPIPAGTYMPLYLQEDAQWSYVPYAGGTIADSGCGLACAAMAVKYLTTQDVTPLTVAEAVGGACLTDGVNDPEKFAQWMQASYGDYAIEATPKFYVTGDALGKVDDGWICFAGLTGRFGDSEYGGHVVLIWLADDSGYWVRDPASAENSARAFTAEELNAVDFRYFVGVKGGHYGNAGN